MNQTLFFISIGAFLVGAYLHVKSCLNFKAYGQFERIPLWKDKYGFFALNRYLIAMAAVLGGLVAAHWFVADFQTWIIVAMFAGVQWISWFINSRDAKKKREVQTRILTSLKEQAAEGNTNPDDATIHAIFNAKLDGKPVNPTVAKAGKAWYRLFPWLTVDAPPTMDGQSAATMPLREKVIAWSQRSPVDWFNI